MLLYAKSSQHIIIMCYYYTSVFVCHLNVWVARRILVEKSEKEVNVQSMHQCFRSSSLPTPSTHSFLPSQTRL